MKKSKWFEVEGRRFKAKTSAKNLKDAWSKTFEKWRLIIQGFFPNDPIITCGLCDLFNNFSDSCRGCPVWWRTGFRFCENTPLGRWSWCKTKMNAEDELNFLKNLKRWVKYRGKM
ncbi:hypothetical protein A2Z67_02715 [Candidatus Woesebacteria bacterium RBG_13_36_22]|uniref:Uncharacterized protein n=1 Tax=Candidatus Woesebacteria bacterium RBG_13_36_22 TaxID=1802478 RepID=A0A1F7X600_9BACT|nr:MAG: hypothetical protein A2Z67_02715 [Candidatus Woesebacteria bacterium RBG_13_36_22]